MYEPVLQDGVPGASLVASFPQKKRNGGKNNKIEKALGKALNSSFNIRKRLRISLKNMAKSAGKSKWS